MSLLTDDFLRPYDVRSARSIDYRPDSTYLRILPVEVSDEDITQELHQLGRISAAVGALSIQCPPVELIGRLGVALDRRAIPSGGIVLGTDGPFIDFPPEFILITATKPLLVQLVDARAACQHLTRWDQELLGQELYHCDENHLRPIAILKGGVLQNDVRFSSRLMGSTPEANRALSSFRLALLLPGITLGVLVSEGMTLALDNRRMLYSIAGSPEYSFPSGWLILVGQEVTDSSNRDVKTNPLPASFSLCG
jgi:hypothetical protein